MYVCMCIYVLYGYVCIYIYICIYICMYIFMCVYVCVRACICLLVHQSPSSSCKKNRFENYMKSKFITTHDSTCNYVVKELILCNIELNKLDELSQE